MPALQRFLSTQFPKWELSTFFASDSCIVYTGRHAFLNECVSPPRGTTVKSDSKATRHGTSNECILTQRKDILEISINEKGNSTTQRNYDTMQWYQLDHSSNDGWSLK